jgi:GNAT superfamily N-acetyltransferase
VAEAGGSARRDMNQKREAAFRDALSKGRPSFFEVYGDDQIWLQSLGTHPDYMRRGFGSALVQWGIQVAKEDHLVVSLVASPMGALLYAHLGFQTLGQIVVQAPEETEKFFFKATVLLVEEEEPAKHEL